MHQNLQFAKEDSLCFAAQLGCVCLHQAEQTDGQQKSRFNYESCLKSFFRCFFPCSENLSSLNPLYVSNLSVSELQSFTALSSPQGALHAQRWSVTLNLDQGLM